jgi:hypothetical protein
MNLLFLGRTFQSAPTKKSSDGKICMGRPACLPLKTILIIQNHQITQRFNNQFVWRIVVDRRESTPDIKYKTAKIW